MKRLILMLSLAGNAVNAVACDKGCSEYQATSNHQPVCACDESTVIGQSAKPSNDKPRHGQVPEWQDGTVHAFTTAPKAKEVETAKNHKGDLIPEDSFNGKRP